MARPRKQKTGFGINWAIEKEESKAFKKERLFDEDVEEAFLLFLAESTTGCVLFMGTKNAAGYGKFSVGGKPISAHRFAWMMEHREPIPKGAQICHSCDNPGCVNPKHLFLGTASLNQKDRGVKQRQAKGKTLKRNINTIPKDEILSIRAAFNKKVPLAELADKHKLSPGQVYDVVQKDDWPWLI